MEIIAVKEKVIKIKNSRNRYIKIPNEIPESDVKHDDIATVFKKKETNELQIIYIFKRED